MALGDVTVFNEAKGFMIDGGWETADDIKCAVCAASALMMQQDEEAAIVTILAML